MRRARRAGGSAVVAAAAAVGLGACSDSRARGPSERVATDEPALVLELLEPEGDPPLLRVEGEALFRFAANRSGPVVLEFERADLPPIALPPSEVSAGVPAEVRVGWASLPPGDLVARGILEWEGGPVESNTVDFRVDEVFDRDGDGAFEHEDCDDTDPTRHPGAAEICDGGDDDCDGDVDEGCERCIPGMERPCYSLGSDHPTKGVGPCRAGSRICDAEGAWRACEGEVLPATESCADSGGDPDCDGVDACTTPACGASPCRTSSGVAGVCTATGCTAVEDCAAPGDEDGDGISDCDDADCFHRGFRWLAGQCVLGTEGARLGAGDSHTCAIDDGRVLWCWGSNLRGQLGTGGAAKEGLPPAVVTEGSRWRSVSVTAGGAHTCGLEPDGTLYCWGRNDEGQLGDGTLVGRPGRVQVTEVTDWRTASAGAAHTCAIRFDSTLSCWGRNSYGQLGYATLGKAPAPRPQALPDHTDWRTASAGVNHTCATKTDGTLWCWGRNHRGQLGDGSAADKISPQRVTEEIDWQIVAAGESHTCGVRAGWLHCWGGNAQGQLGDNSVVDHPLPQPIGEQMGWYAVSAGKGHTCGLLAGGLWCWGSNGLGQLGDGTRVDSLLPLQVTQYNEWREVAAGARHTCARRSDDTVWCWGDNTQGQVVAEDRPEDTWEAAAVGSSPHTCATRSGKLWCWGANAKGQLGDDTTIQPDAPVRIGSSHDWTRTAAGYEFTLGLRDGTLWAWGDNAYGQHGDGTTASKRIPTQVGALNTWSAVSARYAHSCAVAVDGTLWCWGSNAQGQLGDGTIVGRTSPARVGVESDWVGVSAGQPFTCGMRATGPEPHSRTLWCWGSDRYGELADGGARRPYYPVPAQVCRVTSSNPAQPMTCDSDWQRVTSAHTHACGIRSGELWCWGSAFAPLGVEEGYDPVRNVYGKDPSCGDPCKAPVRVDNRTDWQEVASGSTHSCGIRSDMLWCWGSNSQGQVGDGTREHRQLPAQSSSETGWHGLAAGGYRTCALRDAALWCWGNGETSPTPVPGGSEPSTQPEPVRAL